MGTFYLQSIHTKNYIAHSIHLSFSLFRSYTHLLHSFSVCGSFPRYVYICIYSRPYSSQANHDPSHKARPQRQNRDTLLNLFSDPNPSSLTFTFSQYQLTTHPRHVSSYRISVYQTQNSFSIDILLVANVIIWPIRLNHFFFLRGFSNRFSRPYLQIRDFVVSRPPSKPLRSRCIPFFKKVLLRISRFGDGRVPGVNGVETFPKIDKSEHFANSYNNLVSV